MVLGLVLGRIMETMFQRSVGVYGWVSWFGRPIVIIIAGLIAITIFLAVRGIIKDKQSPDRQALGEGAERNPAISLPFAVVLLAFFIWAGISLFDVPEPAWYLPGVVIPPAIVFLLLTLYYDGRDLRRASAEAGGLLAVMKSAADSADLKKVAEFFGWLVGIVVVTFIAGQLVALPIYVALYLWRWGGYRWKVSLGYAAAAWLFLWGFYDQVIHVLWHPSLLFS